MFWLSGVFLLGPLGVYLGIVAVKHAETSTLAPYTLLRLVIAVLGGVVVFHESATFTSILGAILILASCGLAIEHRRAPPGFDRRKGVATCVRSFER